VGYNRIAINLQNQSCTRLIKSSEVEEVTVMPIGKFTIAVTQLLWCSGEDGNPAARLLTNARSQLSAALAVEIGLKDREVT
jgi:hypothetical protein